MDFYFTYKSMYDDLYFLFLFLFFLVKEIKQVPPVPLFNPREIQFSKEDALPPEEKPLPCKQGGNPFGKAANGRY